jgi:hypothetical protein
MSMTGLARLINIPMGLNVNGTMSDADSSGGNPYFSLDQEEGEEKDNDTSSFDTNDCVILNSMEEKILDVPGKAVHLSLSPFFFLFSPFCVPISLQ